LKALDRFSIPPHVNERTGHLPFGFDYQNHQLVTNSVERAAIRMMQEQRTSGLSLREIASKLNSMLMPTKQGGVWQANTVRRILARA
jgi:DNA invertase Pin-like site-specific DNA recombinase